MKKLWEFMKFGERTKHTVHAPTRRIRINMTPYHDLSVNGLQMEVSIRSFLFCADLKNRPISMGGTCFRRARTH